jgi:type II secretory pathway pseudopilin PulG
VASGPHSAAALPRGRPKLSLLEAALVLSLIGIVLAIFVPTFCRRLRTSKIDEASELLEEMSARAAAYYATRWADGRSRCLPPAAGPTPPEPLVDAEQIDFHAPEARGHETWKALGFQPDHPTRYSYAFTPTKHGCDLIGTEHVGTVSFRAVGDLDGDGVRSTFERRATLGPNGWEQADMLHVQQRIE